MSNLKDLEKLRHKLEKQLEKVEEDIEIEETRRNLFKPLICACGKDTWKIRATYNPYQMMAYEWRELILVCDCGQTEQIKVVEDF